MDGFLFQGEQITARALREQIPVYSEGALQSALESGCQDIASVMAHLAKRDSARAKAAVVNGRKGRRVGPPVPMYRRKG